MNRESNTPKTCEYCDGRHRPAVDGAGRIVPCIHAPVEDRRSPDDKPSRKLDAFEAYELLLMKLDELAGDGDA